MPDRKTHLEVDRALFGKEYNKMHAAKDWPAKWMGPRHRSVFHDPASDLLLAMALYPNDTLGAFASGFAHDLIDAASTKAKRIANAKRHKTKTKKDDRR